MHACYKPADLLRTAGARKHFLSLTTITCYSWKKLPLGWRAVVLITMGSTGHDLCCWYLSDVVLLEVWGVSASWEGRCSCQSCNPWKNLKLLGCCNCYSTLVVTVPGKYFCSSVRWNNLNWRMNECYELCVNIAHSEIFTEQVDLWNTMLLATCGVFSPSVIEHEVWLFYIHF